MTTRMAPSPVTDMRNMPASYSGYFQEWDLLFGNVGVMFFFKVTFFSPLMRFMHKLVLVYYCYCYCY